MLRGAGETVGSRARTSSALSAAGQAISINSIFVISGGTGGLAGGRGGVRVEIS